MSYWSECDACSTHMSAPTQAEIIADVHICPNCGEENATNMSGDERVVAIQDLIDKVEQQRTTSLLEILL